jgi:1,2-phenylacetyl-CoA epoxidase catalytic subunit
MNKAQELLSQKAPLKASEKQELSNLIYKIQMELQSNMKFASDMFQETVEKTVSAGKQEIEAFWRSIVEQLGVQKLAEGSNPPQLLENIES